MRSIIFALILISSGTLLAQNSITVAYYESGKIKTISSIHQNEVSFASYYESGELMQTGFLKDGKKDRIWTNYAPDGNKTAIANFKKGEKQGLWKIYDTNGGIAYEVDYSRNLIQNAAKFNESGEVIAYYK